LIAVNRLVLCMGSVRTSLWRIAMSRKTGQLSFGFTATAAFEEARKAAGACRP